MPKLSILICTLTERQPKLARLLAVLQPQCVGRDVTILLKEDQRQATIGEKRQLLLQEAQSEYVCFVDDDDLVSPAYVDTILTALASNPTHCSLRGMLRVNGIDDKLFEHSTRHREWVTTEAGNYIRPPNHLNVIRRDLALQAGFPAKSHGEDHDFSNRLVELGTLVCEAWIEPVLYHYCITRLVRSRQIRVRGAAPIVVRDWLGRNQVKRGPA